jgi:hypothetical protein
MVVLIITSVVHWSRMGNQQLKDNWAQSKAEQPDGAGIARQIYYGICIGMLGLTGFECASLALREWDGV